MISSCASGASALSVSTKGRDRNALRAGAADDNLVDMCRAREDADLPGNVFPTGGFNLRAQPAGQADMFLKTRLIFIAHRIGGRMGDVEREKAGVKRLRHARRLPHQPGVGRRGGQADQQAGARFVDTLNAGKPVGAAAQRDFTQRHQVFRSEKMLLRLTDAAGGIDFARSQPFEQIRYFDVDQLDLVGQIEHIVGHPFAHQHAGQGSDLVVQAFQMLDIERRIDINAVGEQFLYVPAAFGMAAAGRVGVRQLVDQCQLRHPFNDGIQIHFTQSQSPVFKDPGLNALESLGPGSCFGTVVRLEIADDGIHARSSRLPAGLEHRPGFAGSCRVAKEDFQFSPSGEFTLIFHRMFIAQRFVPASITPFSSLECVEREVDFKHRNQIA